MITGVQLRAARAMIRWTVEELAKASNVGVMTVRRAEAVDGASTMMANNAAAIRAALEAAGVQFIPENGGGAGVRLAKPAVATMPSAETSAGRDATAQAMADHQVNRALKAVAASPGEKAVRRDRLTKPPKKPAAPVDEGLRPEDLNAENDD